MCPFFQIIQIQCFRVGGGVWYEKWHLVLGRTWASLTAVWSRGQMCALPLHLPQHSCESIMQIASRVLWFFFMCSSLHVLVVLFCKSASVCWLAPKSHAFASSPTRAGCHLLTKTAVWRFYPNWELVPKWMVSLLFCSWASLLAQVSRLCGQQQLTHWARFVSHSILIRGKGVLGEFLPPLGVLIFC